MALVANEVPEPSADVAPRSQRLSVVFTIPGKLPGWQRAGIRHRTKQIYTPRQTESAEAMVRWYALKAMRGRFLIKGPVRLVINILSPIPKSWSKKKQAAAKFVTGKPDVDNVLKLVADSCNATVWEDDSQIAQAMITRRYSVEPPHVDVIVKPLSDEERS